MAEFLDQPELGTPDPLGERQSMLDAEHRIGRAVHDQRGSLDAIQTI